MCADDQGNLVLGGGGNQNATLSDMWMYCGAVPNVVGLVGLALHVQVLQVEAMGAGFVFSSSSNGVQMTIGQL